MSRSSPEHMSKTLFVRHIYIYIYKIIKMHFINILKNFVYNLSQESEAWRQQRQPLHGSMLPVTQLTLPPIMHNFVGSNANYKLDFKKVAQSYNLYAKYSI